ncbi:hypothetical protein [Sporosarcina saromensis]|uniref:hypothetical protein n=1 Tax=Sporosarcina saromensis TaxID=359365 RepID=UPI00295E6440|nr:hypothetical protein [Sporosarcina saromensis]
MKKLKNISVFATIKQLFLINVANTMPTGATTKVLNQKGLEMWNTIFGIQASIQMTKLDKAITL